LLLQKNLKQHDQQKHFVKFPKALPHLEKESYEIAKKIFGRIWPKF
jgi:hypothetical protein